MSTWQYFEHTTRCYKQSDDYLIEKYLPIFIKLAIIENKSDMIELELDYQNQNETIQFNYLLNTNRGSRPNILNQQRVTKI